MKSKNISGQSSQDKGKQVDFEKCTYFKIQNKLVENNIINFIVHTHSHYGILHCIK